MTSLNTVCRWLPAIGWLLCVAISASAEEAVTTVVADRQEAATAEVVVKTKHNFLLYLPEDYDQKEKHPLLLFLHGAGERGDDQLDRVKVHGPPKHIAQGKQFPCIVVSPQCGEGKWWDAAGLIGLIDHLEAQYKVDSKRIYVTGLSMGGYATWAMIVQQPDRFAAMAPVCGGGNPPIVKYINVVKGKIWAFHGAEDNEVPLSQSEEMVDAFKQVGVDVKFTIYPDVGHNAWDNAYGDEFYDWLFQQELNNDEPSS